MNTAVADLVRETEVSRVARAIAGAKAWLAEGLQAYAWFGYTGSAGHAAYISAAGFPPNVTLNFWEDARFQALVPDEKVRDDVTTIFTDDATDYGYTGLITLEHLHWLVAAHLQMYPEDGDYPEVFVYWETIRQALVDARVEVVTAPYFEDVALAPAMCADDNRQQLLEDLMLAGMGTERRKDEDCHSCYAYRIYFGAQPVAVLIPGVPIELVRDVNRAAGAPVLHHLYVTLDPLPLPRPAVAAAVMEEAPRPVLMEWGQAVQAIRDKLWSQVN